MLDRIAQWAALDLTGVVALPVWAIAAALAIAVLVAMLALMRAGADGRSLPAAVLVLIAVVGACWWVGDYLARRDRAAEQRALDARVFELATRAFMPGSALGCLDPLVAETMEDTCEKTVFASPEATAAAISYVAAQLAVLGSAGEHAADPPKHGTQAWTQRRGSGKQGNSQVQMILMHRDAEQEVPVHDESGYPEHQRHVA